MQRYSGSFLLQVDGLLEKYEKKKHIQQTTCQVWWFAFILDVVVINSQVEREKEKAHSVFPFHSLHSSLLLNEGMDNWWAHEKAEHLYISCVHTERERTLTFSQNNSYLLKFSFLSLFIRKTREEKKLKRSINRFEREGKYACEWIEHHFAMVKRRRPQQYMNSWRKQASNLPLKAEKAKKTAKNLSPIWGTS